MAKVNPIQVQKFLSGMDYPASQRDIMKKAESQGADENVMKTLRQLPSREYETPADISKEIGSIE